MSSRMTARSTLMGMRIVMLWLTATATLCESIRVRSDGGLDGLVVKIDKRIHEDLCPTIIDNLKTLLTESSHVLNKALDNQIYISSVTLVVPSTWRDAVCQAKIGSPSGSTPYRKGDIRVEPEHPIYSKQRPRARQSRGCGKSGDFVSVPADFLLQKPGLNETRLFVNELVKHRYGVFDEFGFNRDRLYPNFFISSGRILPTGTTDSLSNLSGNWVGPKGEPECDPLHSECYFQADITTDDQATCSMSFLPFLPRVNQYCDTVNKMAPTKHNILCEGRTVNEIIHSHPDFKRTIIPNKARAVSNLKPQIDVVREPLPQYAILIETSASMDSNDEWKWINKALQKFIRYDLPVNSHVAIVTFNNVAKVEHSMVQIGSNEVRARLADAIPDKYHLSKSSKSCVLCAMQTLVHDVLSPDTMPGTHVVLITRGSPDSMSITDEKYLADLVAEHNIKTSALILPNNGLDYLSVYESMAHTHVVKSDENIMDFYVDLIEALELSLASDGLYPTEENVRVHEKSFLGFGPGDSSGTFVIDSSLGRDTVFGVFVEDEEEHKIKSISFEDAKGARYGPFVRMSSTFDLINFKTINFPNGQEPPFNRPSNLGMQWKYFIDWHSGGSVAVTASDGGARKSIVVVTSKPRSRNEADLIQVKVWTNADEGQNASSVFPLAVYAEVTRGGQPVLGANVAVKVEVRPFKGDDRSASSAIKLEAKLMEDNGYGDPDLVSGDGIYSLYLTDYPTQGFYSLRVHVDDNSKKAFVATVNGKATEPKSEMLPTAVCCGSAVALSPDQTEKTGDFKRVVQGPTVKIHEIPARDRDILPPSRIGDLKITPLQPGSENLLATWTAPGDDFNDGSVSSYRFVFSEDLSDLILPEDEKTKSPKVLLGFDRHEPSGSQSTYDFKFPHYNTDFYVAIFGYDEAGNRGKISNLVHVYVKTPESLLLDKTKASSEPNSKSIFNITGGNSDLDWIMIGIIAGVVSVLLIMSIVAIGYYYFYFVVNKRRKSEKSAGPAGSTSSMMNGGGSNHDETDSSSFDSDIKHIMGANPLGPALNHRSSVQPSVHHHHNLNPTTTATNGVSSVDSGVSSSSDTPTNLDYQHQHHHHHQQPTHHLAPAHQQTVTPVYWSASQLLSKLDHGSYTTHHVPFGPHSLQSGTRHNVSFSTDYPASRDHIAPTPDWLRELQTKQQQHQSAIPEEYTITVGQLDRSSGKVPPPVMPKPRNITQV